MKKNRKETGAAESGEANAADAAPPSRNSQERAFNRWLNEQLRRKYDPILDEAIPDEILELLRQDREGR